MSLLQRRKLKLASRTNDFAGLTWQDLDKSVKDIEVIVGKNAQLRYGIATESDAGLPEHKFVLVPVVQEWKNEAELQGMYESEVLMSGTHVVVDKKGNAITRDFPVNRALAAVGKVENANRMNQKNIAVDADPDYALAGTTLPDICGEMTMVCAHLNFTQFSADYPDIKEGVRITGAHAVAMAYRTGILESHAGREFVFIQVLPTGKGGYKVGKCDPKYANRPNAAIHEGDMFADGSLRMHEKLVELGLGICIGAGTTHYMMNHTTGGNTLSGHNLKALTVNNLYHVEPGHGEPSEVEQTTFIYNVTHPVNKRAVANLVLPNSKVYSWHKNAYTYAPGIIYSDTFMQYRQNLIPSGAHKAYIAALVLRDIAQAGMAIFLPDVDIAAKVIRIYEAIKDSGARAHVGSRYYTDEPIAVSQTEVDDFLPMAAYYVQHKMATSSLAGSPHLDISVADSANAKWKNIVDATIKLGAFSAPIEQITDYFKLTGGSGFKIDISTADGQKNAALENENMLRHVLALFK